MTRVRGTVAKPGYIQASQANIVGKDDWVMRYDQAAYPDLQVGDLVTFTAGEVATNIKMVKRQRVFRGDAATRIRKY
ncbi:hypothetical protein HYS48_02265 [Candidatus Woesearchaeota archaeon]|nr:hypothetical protein [Candidatus Woesearchaeota archaeon]